MAALLYVAGSVAQSSVQSGLGQHNTTHNNTRAALCLSAHSETPPAVLTSPAPLPHTNTHRIALYVPSAAALIRGGFFYKRGDSDTYDTIISAQHILKSMADSHTADLIKLQLQLPASKQLLKLTGTPSAGSSSRSSSGSDAAPQQHENGPDAAAVVPAGGGVKEGKKGKKGSSGPSAADVEGTLMQLVVAGLSTDEDVSEREREREGGDAGCRGACACCHDISKQIRLQLLSKGWVAGDAGMS